MARLEGADAIDTQERGEHPSRSALVYRPCALERYRRRQLEDRVYGHRSVTLIPRFIESLHDGLPWRCGRTRKPCLHPVHGQGRGTRFCSTSC